MPKLDATVKNPLTGGEVNLLNPMGLVKLFGGITLFYVLYKLATGVGDKLVKRTSNYPIIGQQNPDPYSGISVV